MWPILFHVGQTPVASYGVLVGLGYIVGAVWLMTQVENAEGTTGEYWALAYTLFFAAIVGAKLGFWLVEWRLFLDDPWLMIRYWHWGWVFWGGFGLSIFAGWVFQKAYNRLYKPRRYLPVADYFGAALPMGHWIGRLGCFAKGCCHGAPTAAPWGVSFNNGLAEIPGPLLGVPLHPTQLYEAAAELFICFLLVLHVLPNIRRGRYTYGTAFLGYIVYYSAVRFVVEFFRGDDRGTFLWPVLSPSQWFSLAGLLVAGTMLYRQGIIERHPKTRSIYL